MGIRVTLRKKEISKARFSLYLDFYPAIADRETGEPTRREFLNLYVFEKPKSPIDKAYKSRLLLKLYELCWTKNIFPF